MLSISPTISGRDLATSRVSTRDRDKEKIGRLDQVPAPPAHAFARPGEFNACRDRLLRREPRFVAITSPSETGSVSLESAMSLRGAGGSGKSVLAADMARDDAIRRRFPDGVFWVAAGRGASGTEAKAVTLQADLAVRLGSPLGVATSHLGKHHLTKLLANRACLIILDDVRETIDAQRLDVVDRHSASRILITTRQGQVVSELEAVEVPLEPLSDDQAAAFLASWRDGSDAADATLREVASECGGLPIALAVCGALASVGLPWREIARRLKDLDPAKLKREELDYGLRAIAIAINAFEKTSPETVRRYRELAVFPEQVKIPESVVAMFWEETTRCDARRARHDLETLARMRLLTLEETPSGRRVSLGNIQHDYVKTTHSGLTKSNHQIVEAYRQLLPDGWPTGPDDGYFFQHLIDHLRGAGSHGVARALLQNPDWMTAKLRTSGVVSLITDYEPFVSDEVFALIQGALRLSVAVIERDPSLLRSQLQGRLRGLVGQDVLGKLRESSEGVPWLSSLAPSLNAPGGPLLRTLDGHHASVRAVVLTSDGKHALSASNDKTLRLWNVESGKTVRELRGHADVVNAVALSPDGKYALSASDDHTLRLWNLAAGETVSEMIGHTGIVSAVVFTPDAHYAVSASWDHTLRLWNLGTGVTASTLRGHTDIVTSVVILPDGKRALSASWDHTLRLWDLATGECLGILRGHTGRITAVVITPDGKHALSASWDHTLRIWDLATGETLRELRGHAQLITAVRLTPDGKQAISASHDHTLRLWDLATGATLYELRGHTNLVNAVALTADGKRALSASWDQTLRLWNLTTGKSEGEFQGHTHLVNGVTVSPDGKQAISTSWDLTLQHWDLESCESAREFQGRIRSVNAATLSADGKHVLSAAFDHTIRYWNLETGETVRELKGHTNLVNAVALTPDGKNALTASDDHTLRLWNLKSGAQIASYAADSPLMNCGVSADGSTFVARDSTGRVHLLRQEVA